MKPGNRHPLHEGLYASVLQAAHQAVEFPIRVDDVLALTNPRPDPDPDPQHIEPAEKQFQRAFTSGLAGIPRSERVGALNPTTGHMAESFTATLLDGYGWVPLWQFTELTSSGHGADLLMFSPATEKLLVVEVKGTITARRWPMLRNAEVAQMSAEWLNKKDNPGMAEWDLQGGDVHGLIMLVQFARRRWKAVATTDFANAFPIIEAEQLADPFWSEQSLTS